MDPSLDDFLRKIDLVHSTVRGLADGSTDAKQADQVLETIHNGAAQEAQSQSSEQSVSSFSSVSPSLTERSGKGLTNDYIDFCVSCSIEYLVSTPDCPHCRRSTVSLSSRHSSLRSRVVRLYEEKKIRRERREKFIAAKNENAAFRDLSSWEVFEAESDDESDVGKAPTPELLALERDIEDRHRARQAKGEQAEKLKEKGNTLVKSCDWEGAEACYSAAIDLRKDEKVYYLNRAWCRIKRKQFDLADKDLTMFMEIYEYLEKNKGTKDQKLLLFKALMRRGESRIELGRLEEAAQDYREAIRAIEMGDGVKIDPNDPAIAAPLKQAKEKVEWIEKRLKAREQEKLARLEQEQANTAVKEGMARINEEKTHDIDGELDKLKDFLRDNELGRVEFRLLNGPQMVSKWIIRETNRKQWKRTEKTIDLLRYAMTNEENQLLIGNSSVYSTLIDFFYSDDGIAAIAPGLSPFHINLLASIANFYLYSSELHLLRPVLRRFGPYFMDLFFALQKKFILFVSSPSGSERRGVLKVAGIVIGVLANLVCSDDGQKAIKQSEPEREKEREKTLEESPEYVEYKKARPTSVNRQSKSDLDRPMLDTMLDSLSQFFSPFLLADLPSLSDYADSSVEPILTSPAFLFLLDMILEFESFFSSAFTFLTNFLTLPTLRLKLLERDQNAGKDAALSRILTAALQRFSLAYLALLRFPAKSNTVAEASRRISVFSGLIEGCAAVLLNLVTIDAQAADRVAIGCETIVPIIAELSRAGEAANLASQARLVGLMSKVLKKSEIRDSLTKRRGAEVMLRCLARAQEEKENQTSAEALKEAAVRSLAVLLSAQESMVDQLDRKIGKSTNGFQLLTAVVGDANPLVAGNATLCIGIAAKAIQSGASKLKDEGRFKGSMMPLIALLRKTGHQSAANFDAARENAAIACARLATLNPEYLALLRQEKAMEVMMALAAKR